MAEFLVGLFMLGGVVAMVIAAIQHPGGALCVGGAAGLFFALAASVQGAGAFARAINDPDGQPQATGGLIGALAPRGYSREWQEALEAEARVLRSQPLRDAGAEAALWEAENALRVARHYHEPGPQRKAAAALRYAGSTSDVTLPRPPEETPRTGGVGGCVVVVVLVFAFVVALATASWLGVRP